MKRTLILVIIFSIGIGNLYAQNALQRLGNRIIKRAGDQVEQRVEHTAEEGVEKAMDQVEEAARNSGKAQTTNQKADADTSTEKEADDKRTESPSAPSPQKEPASIQSFSQYDFVPGDSVLLFEDFSQDAVGDFPAHWTTSGSGEVKMLNIAEGKWLHLTATSNPYQLMQQLTLPDNYIVEFDVILPPTDQNPPAIWMCLFKAEAQDLGNVLTNPLAAGFGVYIEASEHNSWIGKAYNDGNWVEGSSTLAPTKENQAEHIIVWIQKRRLRMYHAGQKVLDLPTLLPANLRPDRLTFDLSDCNNATPYISNIRITTAAPDMRNKLLEEGRLVSYGIYFAVNSDKVKPESYGTLNDLAKVIQEANVKVQIVGHTDKSGSDATNLDLSKRRAAAVKGELVKLGVSEELLTTDGAGASKPIAPNDTPSNKALNRRVEFVKM